MEQAASKVGLKINREKTNIIELIENEDDTDNDDDKDVIFEKVNEFQYLELTLNVKNYQAKEIRIRITKPEGRHSFLVSF